jgi:hypothetical protein
MFFHIVLVLTTEQLAGGGAASLSQPELLPNVK